MVPLAEGLGCEPDLLMQCVSPINGPLGQRYPCGKCVACKKKRQGEWSLRLMHELDSWSEATFVTLTYNDEHVPKNMSLEKAELQRYFKRLRKQSGKKLRYYACGEYGEINYRPHYHAIIFGIGPHDPHLEDCWGLGFIKSGTVTPASVSYVAGYIGKKLWGIGAKQVYEGREIPFQLSSQRLGFEWLEKNEAQVLEYLEITMNGTVYSIPRYYVKKLGEKISVEKMETKKMMRIVEQQEKSLKKGMNPLSEARREIDLREQNRLLLERQFESKIDVKRL